MCTGRAKPKPYRSSHFPGISELQRVTEKCKACLLQHGRPAKLKQLPDAVQVVVLTTIATLALKRPQFAEGCVTALVQAADSMKDIGMPLMTVSVLTGYESRVRLHPQNDVQSCPALFVDLKNADRSKRPKSSVASIRKACVDAFLLILKAEDPVLKKQEQRLCGGLHTLKESQQAQDAIKRREMYVSFDDRSPFSCICNLP